MGSTFVKILPGFITEICDDETERFSIKAIAVAAMYGAFISFAAYLVFVSNALVWYYGFRFLPNTISVKATSEYFDDRRPVTRTNSTFSGNWTAMRNDAEEYASVKIKGADKRIDFDNAALSKAENKHTGKGATIMLQRHVGSVQLDSMLAVIKNPGMEIVVLNTSGDAESIHFRDEIVDSLVARGFSRTTGTQGAIHGAHIYGAMSINRHDDSYSIIIYPLGRQVQ